MLVTCPECGAKISSDADPCPKCGRSDAGRHSKEWHEYQQKELDRLRREDDKKIKDRKKYILCLNKKIQEKANYFQRFERCDQCFRHYSPHYYKLESVKEVSVSDVEIFYRCAVCGDSSRFQILSLSDLEYFSRGLTALPSDLRKTEGWPILLILIIVILLVVFLVAKWLL
jgi:hypothetical protein